MRYDTLFKRAFTGEYWDYTTEQGIDGQLTHTYFKVRDIRFSLISAEKGTMYLFSEDQLRYNAQVRSLRDASGNPVFVQDISGMEELSYIGVSEPVFDINGSVIGYRHDLSQGVA